MSNPFDELAENPQGLNEKHLAAAEFFIGLKEKNAAPKTLQVDKATASKLNKSLRESTGAPAKDLKLRAAIRNKGMAKIDKPTTNKLPRDIKRSDAAPASTVAAISRQAPDIAKTTTKAINKDKAIKALKAKFNNTAAV
jgi:hypothetical protein